MGWVGLNEKYCYFLLHFVFVILQWRRKQFESGVAHGERGARAYKGVWGQSPQRGPGAEPLVRGRSPLKLKGF